MDNLQHCEFGFKPVLSYYVNLDSESNLLLDLWGSIRFGQVRTCIKLGMTL